MKKTSALLTFLIALNFVTLTSLHAKDESICLKNGREFYITLANYLGLSGNLRNYKEKFVELANNLPKQGHMSEFAPSLASLVQLTDKICVDYANNTAPPTEDLGMKYRKGDAANIINYINNEILEGFISDSSKFIEDEESYYLNYDLPLNIDRIYVTCNYYFRDYLYILKPNFKNGYDFNGRDDSSNYCEKVAPSIFKMFEDRERQEQGLQAQNVIAPSLRNLINGSYIKILNRAANATEIENFNSMAITDENQMAYISCVSAAASLEFIRNGRPCD